MNTSDSLTGARFDLAVTHDVLSRMRVAPPQKILLQWLHCTCGEVACSLSTMTEDQTMPSRLGSTLVTLRMRDEPGGGAERSSCWPQRPKGEGCHDVRRARVGRFVHDERVHLHASEGLFAVRHEGLGAMLVAILDKQLVDCPYHGVERDDRLLDRDKPHVYYVLVTCRSLYPRPL